MTELSLLTDQLHSLTQMSYTMLILGVTSFGAGMIITLKVDTILPLAVGGIIFFCFATFGIYEGSEVSKVTAQIDSLKKEAVTKMPCDDLRTDLVNQMINQTNDTLFNFKKDFYYLHCETPLRNEVLKLEGKS